MTRKSSWYLMNVTNCQQIILCGCQILLLLSDGCNCSCEHNFINRNAAFYGNNNGNGCDCDQEHSTQKTKKQPTEKSYQRLNEIKTKQPK